MAANRCGLASLSSPEDLAQRRPRVGVVAGKRFRIDGIDRAEVPAAAPGIERVALVVGLDQLRRAVALEVAREEQRGMLRARRGTAC